MSHQKAHSHNKPIRNILLIIAYDGSEYEGWQKQGDKPTIQIVIEKVLHTILQENVKLVCAGRTDSGVHSVGNRAHFNTISKIKNEKLLKGLNSLLPLDIRILKAEDKPINFHARYHAVRRWYRYYIYNGRVLNPFARKYSLFYQESIDISQLRKTLHYLLGSHDFTSFSALKDESNIKVRTIFHMAVNRHKNYYYVDIIGSGFLHNMIRIIVGTALLINRKKMAPVKMKEILLSKNRVEAGTTVAPQGLFFVKVSYKEDLSCLDKIMPARGCPHLLFNHLC